MKNCYKISLIFTIFFILKTGVCEADNFFEQYWVLETPLIEKDKRTVSEDGIVTSISPQVETFNLAKGLYFKKVSPEKEKLGFLVFFCRGREDLKEQTPLNWVDVASVIVEGNDSFSISNPGFEINCRISRMNNSRSVVLSGDWGNVTLTPVSKSDFMETCYLTKENEIIPIENLSNIAIVQLSVTSIDLSTSTMKFEIESVVIGGAKIEGRVLTAKVSQKQLRERKQHKYVGIVRIKERELKLRNLILVNH